MNEKEKLVKERIKKIKEYIKWNRLMKALILLVYILIFTSGCTTKVYEKCTVVRIDETKLFGMTVNTGIGYYCETIDGVKQK